MNYCLYLRVGDAFEEAPLAEKVHFYLEYCLRVLVLVALFRVFSLSLSFSSVCTCMQYFWFSYKSVALQVLELNRLSDECMEMGKPAPRFVMNEPIAVRLLEFEYIREVLLDAIPGDREGYVLSACVFSIASVVHVFVSHATTTTTTAVNVLVSFRCLHPAGRSSSS